MNKEDTESNKQGYIVHKDISDFQTEALKEQECRKKSILNNLDSIPHRPANSSMNSRGEIPPVYLRNDRILNSKVIE